MARPAPTPYVPYADYLAREEASATRHEWLNGVLFDMPGGTVEHAGLAVAVTSRLSRELQGKRCVVFSSDLKIRVLATGLCTYPDASVVCGPLERDPDSRHAITNPTVLVEILSDSTEGYDRGQKFAHYRRIPSLREYVLVAQDPPRIEVFRKNPEGLWVLASEAGPGEVATLASIDCALPVDELYVDPLAEVAPGA